MSWICCIFILRGVIYHCSFYYIGLWSASKSGMSKEVAPAFLFTLTVSGFHSKMEREVLDFLLKGRCGIICVLARPIYKVVPTNFRDAFEQARVLFISRNNGKSTMTSRHLCQQRNEYIASISDELVFSSLTSESSLYLIASSKSGKIIL